MSEPRSNGAVQWSRSGRPAAPHRLRPTPGSRRLLRKQVSLPVAVAIVVIVALVVCAGVFAVRSSKESRNQTQLRQRLQQYPSTPDVPD
jgi:hypothetical protein